ncbi:unnamed protein product, partial [Prorocentrum cordatum]
EGGHWRRNARARPHSATVAHVTAARRRRLGVGGASGRWRAASGPARMSRRWRVVKPGGVVVRREANLASPAIDAKLCHGAVVRELELRGLRLQYEIGGEDVGCGPRLGWVTVALGSGEVLLEPEGAEPPPPPLPRLAAGTVPGDRHMHTDSDGVLRGHCVGCGGCSFWRCSTSVGVQWSRGAPRRRAAGPRPCGCAAEDDAGRWERCEACGCHAHLHADLTPWLQSVFDCLHEFRRFGANGVRRHLPARCHLPTDAYQGWRLEDVALFVLTGSLLDPRAAGTPPDPAPCAESRGIQAGPLISVCVPTSTRRHRFHRLVYRNFVRQTHEPKQLVVVDTGSRPSPFFRGHEPTADSREASADARVLYRFFQVTDATEEKLELSRGLQGVGPLLGIGWSLGLKRNIAVHLSEGEVLAHFDDDDLYAPGYLAFMLGRLLDTARARGPEWEDGARRGERPAIVTLSEWHTFHLLDRTFAYLNPKVDRGVPRAWLDEMVYGWGFSYVYTRAAWRAQRFPDRETWEDNEFINGLRRRKDVLVKPVARPGDVAALVAHTLHPDSTSGGEFDGFRRLGQAVRGTPRGFEELLPLAEATLRWRPFVLPDQRVPLAPDVQEHLRTGQAAAPAEASQDVAAADPETQKAKHASSPQSQQAETPLEQLRTLPQQGTAAADALPRQAEPPLELQPPQQGAEPSVQQPQQADPSMQQLCVLSLQSTAAADALPQQAELPLRLRPPQQAEPSAPQPQQADPLLEQLCVHLQQRPAAADVLPQQAELPVELRPTQQGAEPSVPQPQQADPSMQQLCVHPQQGTAVADALPQQAEVLLELRPPQQGAEPSDPQLQQADLSLEQLCVHPQQSPAAADAPPQQAEPPLELRPPQQGAEPPPQLQKTEPSLEQLRMPLQQGKAAVDSLPQQAEPFLELRRPTFPQEDAVASGPKPQKAETLVEPLRIPPQQDTAALDAVPQQAEPPLGLWRSALQQACPTASARRCQSKEERPTGGCTTSMEKIAKACNLRQRGFSARRTSGKNVGALSEREMLLLAKRLDNMTSKMEAMVQQLSQDRRTVVDIVGALADIDAAGRSCYENGLQLKKDTVESIDRGPADAAFGDKSCLEPGRVSLGKAGAEAPSGDRCAAADARRAVLPGPAAQRAAARLGAVDEEHGLEKATTVGAAEAEDQEEPCGGGSREAAVLPPAKPAGDGDGRAAAARRPPRSVEGSHAHENQSVALLIRRFDSLPHPCALGPGREDPRKAGVRRPRGRCRVSPAAAAVQRPQRRGGAAPEIEAGCAVAEPHGDGRRLVALGGGCGAAAQTAAEPAAELGVEDRGRAGAEARGEVSGALAEPAAAPADGGRGEAADQERLGRDGCVGAADAAAEPRPAEPVGLGRGAAAAAGPTPTAGCAAHSVADWIRQLDSLPRPTALGPGATQAAPRGGRQVRPSQEGLRGAAVRRRRSRCRFFASVAVEERPRRRGEAAAAAGAPDVEEGCAVAEPDCTGRGRAAFGGGCGEAAQTAAEAGPADGGRGEAEDQEKLGRDVSDDAGDAAAEPVEDCLCNAAVAGALHANEMPAECCVGQSVAQLIRQLDSLPRPIALGPGATPATPRGGRLRKPAVRRRRSRCWLLAQAVALDSPKRHGEAAAAAGAPDVEDGCAVADPAIPTDGGRGEAEDQEKFGRDVSVDADGDVAAEPVEDCLCNAAVAGALHANEMPAEGCVGQSVAQLIRQLDSLPRPMALGPIAMEPIALDVEAGCADAEPDGDGRGWAALGGGRGEAAQTAAELAAGLESEDRGTSCEEACSRVADAAGEPVAAEALGPEGLGRRCGETRREVSGALAEPAAAPADGGRGAAADQERLGRDGCVGAADAAAEPRPAEPVGLGRGAAAAAGPLHATEPPTAGCAAHSVADLICRFDGRRGGRAAQLCRAAAAGAPEARGATGGPRGGGRPAGEGGAAGPAEAGRWAAAPAGAAGAEGESARASSRGVGEDTAGRPRGAAAAAPEGAGARAPQGARSAAAFGAGAA